MHENTEGMLDKVQLSLEKFVVQRADFLIANTKELAEEFIDRFGISHSKVGVIPCGYRKRDFDIDIDWSKREPDRFVISHVGTFYNERDPTNFLIAVKRALTSGRIPASKLRVNLVGKIAVPSEELSGLLEELQELDVVTIRPWLPHDEAIELLYLSDALLSVQVNAPVQIPAKVYEYCYVGRPILSICDPDGAVERFLNELQTGISVAPGDIDGIERELVTLFEGGGRKEAAEQFHSSATIDDYSYDVLAKRLEGIWTAVVEGATGT